MYLERVKPEISDSCLIDRWYPARRRRLRRRRRRSLPGDRASWRPHTKQSVRLGHGSTTSICQPSSTLDRWVAWCRRAGTVSDLYDEEVGLAVRRSCRSIHPRPRRGCTASLDKLFTPIYLDAAVCFRYCRVVSLVACTFDTGSARGLPPQSVITVRPHAPMTAQITGFYRATLC